MAVIFQWQDLVNGIFEFGIGCWAVLNVKAILRDKKLLGVHWGVTGWATAWGLYNLYYYPHLGQWLSFSGGCWIVTVNSTWLALVAYYKAKELTAIPEIC